ncbi:MAG: potassium channel family protein [Promethearchaeota archaeon]
MSSEHKKIEKISYEFVSAKDLLTWMKTYSELMIDLAYSALLFSSEELRDYVMELENKVDRLAYQLFMSLSLSVRDKEDAELAVGLFRVATTANKISAAAADMASLVERGYDSHPLFAGMFAFTEERLAMAHVGADSPLIGETVDGIWEKCDINVDVIATRRDGEWRLNPAGTHEVCEGEILFARGSEHEIESLERLASGKVTQKPGLQSDEPELPHVRLMLEMKETSEFMVSLAYAAVTFDDAGLAEEVSEMEDRLDDLCDIMTKEILSMQGDVNRRSDLIQIAYATEQIADAAWEMAMVQLSGLQTHPIIKNIVNEADEIVAKVVLSDTSPLVGKSLEELALGDNYGLYVLSVKREGFWLHRPLDEMHLKAGDILIVDGYKEGLAELREVNDTKA